MVTHTVGHCKISRYVGRFVALLTPLGTVSFVCTYVRRFVVVTQAVGHWKISRNVGRFVALITPLDIFKISRYVGRFVALLTSMHF